MQNKLKRIFTCLLIIFFVTSFFYTSNSVSSVGVSCSNGAADCGELKNYTITASCDLHGFGGTGQTCHSWEDTNTTGNFMSNRVDGQFPSGEFVYSDAGGEYNVKLFAGVGSATMGNPDDSGNMYVGDFSYSYVGSACNGAATGGVTRSANLSPGDQIYLSVTNGCDAPRCSSNGTYSPIAEECQTGNDANGNPIQICVTPLQSCLNAGGGAIACHNSTYGQCSRWGANTGTATLGGTFCYSRNNPKSGGVDYHPTASGVCTGGTPAVVNSFTCSSGTLAWSTTGFTNFSVKNSTGTIISTSATGSAGIIRNGSGVIISGSAIPNGTYYLYTGSTMITPGGYTTCSYSGPAISVTPNLSLNADGSVSATLGQTLTIPFNFSNTGASGSSVRVDSNGCGVAPSGVTVAPFGLDCPNPNPVILNKP